MADRLYTDLSARIATSVHGCPSVTIDEHVRNVAIEVCEKTLAWRYIQADKVLVDGTYDYLFVPPSGAEAHDVISATINDVPLKSVTLEEIRRRYPTWPTTASAQRSQPQYFTHIDPTKYHVVPTPDAAATYTVRMLLALKPTRASTGMEQAYFDELEDVIVDGVLQRLLVLPGKPWEDRELAAYHAKQYIFKTAGRRARTNVGPGGAALTAQMVPFV